MKGGIKIKEDARIVKTKTSLVSSFEVLLSEKKYEDITVNEICERAAIRRATFYKHFEDKSDFLKYFIYTLRVKFDSVGKYGLPDETVGYYVEYAHEIVDFMDANDSLLRNILESKEAGNIINTIIVENLKETKLNLHKSVEEGLKLPASVDTVAAMLVGGIAVIIINWFQLGKSIPKELLLKEITAMIHLGESNK